MNNLVKPGSVLGNVLDQVKPAVKDVKNQISPEEKTLEQGGQSKNNQQKVAQNDAVQKQQTEDIVKALYGTSESSNKPEKKEKSKDGEMSDEQFQKFLESKTPEEQRQLLQLRKILHEEYYRKLTQPKQQEERQAEKVEREDKEEKMEFMKKEDKKPKSIAVQREQNKAEMFRGASG